MYLKQLGTWTEIQKLIASDGLTSTSFGWSLTFDSENTLIVGALGRLLEKVPRFAYVSSEDRRSVDRSARITPSTGLSYDNFGTTVSMDGNTLVVAATWHESSGMPINSGTIYAFEYNSSNGLWEEFQEITPSSSSLAQAFWNGYGFTWQYAYCQCSIYKENTTGDAGRVTVFTRQNGNFVETQILSPSNPVTGRKFGSITHF